MTAASLLDGDGPKTRRIPAVLLAGFSFWSGLMWSAEAKRWLSRVMSAGLLATALRDVVRSRREDGGAGMSGWERGAYLALAGGHAIAAWWPRPFDTD